MRLQLLHGPAVPRALAGAESTKVFRYTFNKRGGIFLGSMGGIFVLGAALTLGLTGLEGAHWIALFAACLVVAGALFVYTYYWYRFAIDRFVVVAQESLIVGTKDRAWRMEREVLTVERLGFRDFEAAGLKGVLQIELGGQRIPLHLYHPLVHLNALESFVVELLTPLQQIEDSSETIEDRRENEA